MIHWVLNTPLARGVSRAAATSKMECFVMIVNGFQPLTIITKRSILDVAAVLDPPLNVLTTTELLNGKQLYGFLGGTLDAI